MNQRKKGREGEERTTTMTTNQTGDLPIGKRKFDQPNFNKKVTLRFCKHHNSRVKIDISSIKEIKFKISESTAADLTEVRLCVRPQGEDLVVANHSIREHSIEDQKEQCSAITGIRA